MTLATRLLELSYKRELELEELMEDTFRSNLWFIEETKEFNIQIQIACLKYLERQRRLEEFRSELPN